MGRNIGTNVYSNNFEPQVMGLLDARTRVDTKADLTKEATWTSSDGNTYAPVGIRVSVTDDSTSGNNGVYMLLSEDYAIASNWMKIGSDGSSGGSAEFVMVDLSNINAIPGIYSPDKYIHGEFAKIIDAIANNLPFFVFTFDGEIGLFATSCVTDGTEIMLTILYRDEIWLINFDGGNYTVAKADIGGGGGSSTSNVKVLTTPDLLNTSRTSTINLSAADIAIIKGLLVGKDIVIYSGNVGAGKFYIPLNIANAGNNNIQIYQTTVLMAGVIYTFTINTTNLTTYTASKLTKIEGSGGGESNVEFIDLSQIAAQNDTNVPASESLKTELEKLYDVVASTKIPFANWFDNIEGKYPISIKDDSGTNTTFTVLFNNELWEVDYNRATSTYSTTKVENGQGGGSNIKFLNTPDLFSRDRQTIISLNVNDQDVIKSLYSNNYQQTPIFYVGSMTGDEGIYPISIACSSFTTTIDPYGDVVYLSTINDVGESYKISIDVIDWVASLPKQVPSSSATTSKHDLSIDVKTYSPQGIAPKIYFRIREKAPNGRIHFVRKKRMRYFDRNDNLIRSLGYAVMEADCHHDGGVDVSTLSPNTWYEYPITGVDLISSYPPGSSVNGKVRTHGVIRFKGATYAKSFEFKNAPFTQTQTTLHAGLQYNVLSGKKSPLFKERGEVVPIDVRLIILSTSNYNAGYEYSYVVQ